MSRRFLAALLLGSALALPALAADGPSVLLISVDGLRPDLVLDGSAHGTDLASIRANFVAQGAYAPEGMVSVTPSLTYPNHQAMITGTFPATNGTVGNAVFDPTGVHDGAWAWWASAAVPTLWQVAHAGGYLSVNVGFPTSGGVPMDINIPDFWRDGTPLDDQILNMVSTPPGIVRSMLAATGITGYPGDAYDIASDRKRLAGMLWVLENEVAPKHEPFFMTGYFGLYDHDAHDHGPFSPEALGSAKEIDAMVGEVVTAARKAAGGDLVVVLASDHGFMSIDKQVRPNVALREAGLIALDANGKISSWKAYFQRAGGMGQVRLAAPSDTETRRAVEAVLAKLAADPESGVEEVLDRKGIAALHTFPDADYLLVMKAGVEPRDDVDGPYVAPKLGQAATHGFRSDLPEMKASLFMSGPGVPTGPVLDGAAMVDVAPTLATLMGLSLPTAEGVNLLTAPASGG